MSEEDELSLGTIAGVNLILSPENHKKYKETLNKQIEELKSQLERKENIIKEVREYILTHKLYCFEYDDEELFEIVTDKIAKDELFKILDKVN